MAGLDDGDAQVVTGSHDPSADSTLSPIAQAALAEDSAIAPKSKDLKKQASKTFDKSSLNVSSESTDEEEVSTESENIDTSDEEPEVEEEPVPESFELKVNGKTYKAKDVEALKAMAQRGIATQQAVDKERSQMQAMRREAEDAVARVNAIAKMTPAELLLKLDPAAAKEAAYKLLEEDAREAQEMEGMSEREKSFYLKSKEADKYRSEQEKSAKTREEQEMATLVAQQEAQISGTLSAALEEGGYKISPGNTIPVRIASALYRASIEKGIDVSPKELAVQVKAQMERVHDSFYGSMDAQTFVTRHPKLAEQVREYFVKSSGVKPKGSVQAKRDPESGKFKPAPKRSKSDEFERMIRRLKDEGRAELQKNGQPFSLD